MLYYQLITGLEHHYRFRISERLSAFRIRKEWKEMSENSKRTQSARVRQEAQYIDLLELSSLFLEKWPAILIGLLIGAVAFGSITFFLITPKYKATAKLYMVSSSSDSVVDLTDLNIGTSLSSDYAELLKVRPILEEIIREEKLDYTYKELFDMITLTSIADTRILVIDVLSTDPKEAKVIANALATKAESEIPRLMDTAKPNVAEYAIVPEYKNSPSLPKNTLIGGMIGALLVMGFYTVLYMMDDTLNSAEDVEKLLGVMPLTVIPEVDLSGMSDKRMSKNKRLIS